MSYSGTTSIRLWVGKKNWVPFWMILKATLSSKSREQRAESREQRAESREQRAEEDDPLISMPS